MDDRQFGKLESRGTLNLSGSCNNDSISFGSMLKGFNISRSGRKYEPDNEEEFDNLLDKLDCTSRDPSNAELLRPSPRSTNRRIKLF